MDITTDTNTNTNTEKNINIIGTGTRYQMKKVMKSNKDVKIKKKKEENYIIKNVDQMNIINNLKKDNNDNDIVKNGLKYIKNKLSSYKQQDIIKGKYEKNAFITLKDLIDILDECKLKCHYCSSNIFILYDIVRDNKQWTLDRIDNEKGHNKDNVVIACLECNLKRRNIQKDAFLFTRQLKIIREEYSN
jgi:5-methylcytosine-specific restriction endonuclease McrA